MPGMTTGTPPPRLTLARMFTEWSLHPWSALVIAILVVAYLGTVHAARRHGGTWQARDTFAWIAGCGVLVVATQGSPAAYGDALFWMHMVAHLMLIMIVPMLLLLGRPLDLALAAARPAHATRLRAGFEGGVLSVMTHPGFGVVVYGAAIAGTHLTGFMNSMMMHPWLHGLEQVLYVTAGVLFFLPLLGEQPIRWKLAAPLRMAVLVVAMPIDTFTGVILGQMTTYPWPMMAADHPAWAPDLLTDLHAGGAVMWIGGDAIMAVLFGIAALSWARSAALGDGSELGGWLSAARANYQSDLLATSTGRSGDDRAAAAPDSDEALAAYNAYLKRLQRQD